MTSQNSALLSTIQDVKHILSFLLFCTPQKSRTLSSTPRTKCAMRGEGRFCAARQQDPRHLTNTTGESYTILTAAVISVTSSTRISKTFIQEIVQQNNRVMIDFYGKNKQKLLFTIVPCCFFKGTTMGLCWTKRSISMMKICCSET